MLSAGSRAQKLAAQRPALHLVEHALGQSQVESAGAFHQARGDSEQPAPQHGGAVDLARLDEMLVRKFGASGGPGFPALPDQGGREKHGNQVGGITPPVCGA